MRKKMADWREAREASEKGGRVRPWPVKQLLLLLLFRGSFPYPGDLASPRIVVRE